MPCSGPASFLGKRLKTYTATLSKRHMIPPPTGFRSPLWHGRLARTTTARGSKRELSDGRILSLRRLGLALRAKPECPQAKRPASANASRADVDSSWWTWQSALTGFRPHAAHGVANRSEARHSHHRPLTWFGHARGVVIDLHGHVLCIRAFPDRIIGGCPPIS